MKHLRNDYSHIQDNTGRIGDDEPVFLIRAKDKVSGAAVRKWAELALEAGADPTLCARVMSFALEMDRYRENALSGGKVPDCPESELLS